MIPWLDKHNPIFPEVKTALREPNGLLAAGGNLLPDTLVDAYMRGIFPWFNQGDPILWWSPNPRSVLKVANIHVSRRLKKTLRQQRFFVTFDHAFEQVIHECARPRELCEQASWIHQPMIDAYQTLHEKGIAHSVEVYDQATHRLVGGLYGLALGKVFFGESMFTRVTDASKVGFVTLCERLASAGFVWIDCQVQSAHLDSFGAQLMPRDDFCAMLRVLC